MKLILVNPTRSRADKLRFKTCQQSSSKIAKKKAKRVDLQGTCSTRTLFPLVFHNAHIKKDNTDQQFSFDEPTVPKQKALNEPQSGTRTFQAVKPKADLSMRAGIDFDSFKADSHKVTRQSFSNKSKKIIFIPSISDDSKKSAVTEKKRHPSQTIINFAYSTDSNNDLIKNDFTNAGKLESNRLMEDLKNLPSGPPSDVLIGDQTNVANRIGKLKSEVRQSLNRNQLRLQSGYSTCTFRVNIKNR